MLGNSISLSVLHFKFDEFLSSACFIMPLDGKEKCLCIGVRMVLISALPEREYLMLIRCGGQSQYIAVCILLAREG